MGWFHIRRHTVKWLCLSDTLKSYKYNIKYTGNPADEEYSGRDNKTQLWDQMSKC